MEIGNRIKSLRARAGMSQEDLAGRIYVSRQTISSWENDKTYPDVQSLLLLSEIFDVTVDSLIKEDVMTMTKTIDSDVRAMKQMAWVMVVFLLLMIAAMAWLVVQTVVWDWDLAYAVPTFVLALVLWCVALCAAVQVERIKKSHDLVTYREILSYWCGEPVDRDTEKSRRERLIPVWMKTIRFVGMMVLAAAIGYGFAMLVDRLVG
ncbi:helix-turn-helix transcriptional regulator [Collinsella ihumii]|uniref:helix-turn-helix transcriptional regulator n=1 Tax=Collinsella ihumii TaxID=1720204 RepID=UPI00082C2A73|nr:helix-turn-helix transcriptional regulator [Collinsella ihumii]